MRTVRISLALALLSTPLALSSGCSRYGAYFNTFYHAKKYFNDAERMVENSASERLPPEAVRLYDKSIEKCQKVIDRGGGWWAGVDDALYLMGAAYYGKKEYDEALLRFEELFKEHPDSEHIPDALFLTGLSYHRKRDYERADAFFDRIETEYPDYERGDEILFLVGRGFQDDGEERRAITTYNRLIEAYPGSGHREEVLRRIGDIYFEKSRYDSSLAAFERLGDVTRDDETYVEANLRAGEAEVRMGRYGDAINRYKSLIPDDPRDLEDTPRVWIHMAAAYNLNDDPRSALSVLEDVIEDYGQTTHGVEARFQTGYTYEVYLRDFEKARAYYQEAQSLRTRSVFSGEARERLKNLDTIEELQSKARSEEEEDREARAEAAIRVAELMYFGSDRPAEAIEEYKKVHEDFRDTSVGPRAAYAVAYIQHADEDIPGDGADDFRRVIMEYPRSAQADYALKILEERGDADDSLRAVVSTAKEQSRLEELTEKLLADSLARARGDSLRALSEGTEAGPSRDATSPGVADTLLMGPPVPGGKPEETATEQRIGPPRPVPTLEESEMFFERMLRTGRDPRLWQARLDSVRALMDSSRAVRDSTATDGDPRPPEGVSPLRERFP